MRVLCVEDHDDVRKTLGLLLEALGHEPVTVAKGDDAMAIVDAGLDGYGLLLTDLRLPGPDGLAIATRARKRRPDLAVVVISGYMTTTDEAHIEALPATALRKPFSTRDLETALSAALEQATATRAP
jgi:DNA-binding response OmpR family regulator